MSNVTTVQSVDRAIYILEKLKENPNGLGITELSVTLGVSKSTVHRLLMSLFKAGFVKQDPLTDKYQLGLKCLELGDVVSENLDVRKNASPLLNELSFKTGETVHLVVMELNEMVYIDKVESPETIRMYSRVGKRAPMHCTGVGKVFLAHLPIDEVEKIITEKSMRKFTENTLITKEDLYAQLDIIRNRGYAIDDQEHELGVKCAAAPIMDSRGTIIAAISVSTPIMRLDSNKFNYIISEVLAYSQKISESLGSFLTFN
ncbi:helix-turn-helix domain-containing protein [Virgibacillus dakarensis]|uniref:Glycerol operon regulatory protein n=1 Tax=Lentibacillus populi TaxID=1827502 RepID=A0A9W5X475_9BACI|nr:IclR family transcriptional regulator [Lentibacillus populi]MTW87205.1 helix-turn-helix domain-containing protein [Virgibacillus dakarensis]GGB31897.1 IclR family transcriptional regulator [Lentibacillus populi]